MATYKIAHSKLYDLTFALERYFDPTSKQTGLSFLILEPTGPNSFRTLNKRADCTVWNTEQLVGLWFAVHSTKNLYHNILSGNRKLASFMKPKSWSIKTKGLAFQSRLEIEDEKGNASKDSIAYNVLPEEETTDAQLKLAVHFAFPKPWRFRLNNASCKALDKGLRAYLATSLVNTPIIDENGSVVTLTVHPMGLIFHVKPGVEQAAHLGERQARQVFIPAGERAETLHTFLDRASTPGQLNVGRLQVGTNNVGIKFERGEDNIFNVTFYHEDISVTCRLTFVLLAYLLLGCELVDGNLLAPHSVVVNDNDHKAIRAYANHARESDDALTIQAIARFAETCRRNGFQPLSEPSEVLLEGGMGRTAHIM